MCPVLHQYHRGFPASRPRACTSPSSTGLPVSNLARLRVHRGHVHLSSSLTDCITCAHTRHQHRTTSNTSHTQQRSLFPVAPQQQRTPRPKGACALRDRTPNAPQYARHPRPHRAGSGQARSPRVPGELPGRAKANLEKIPGPLRENRAQQPQIMPRPADQLPRPPNPTRTEMPEPEGSGVVEPRRAPNASLVRTSNGDARVHQTQNRTAECTHRVGVLAASL